MGLSLQRGRVEQMGLGFAQLGVGLAVALAALAAHSEGQVPGNLERSSYGAGKALAHTVPQDASTAPGYMLAVKSEPVLAIPVGFAVRFDF